MTKFPEYRLDLVFSGLSDCCLLSYFWGTIAHMLSHCKPNFKAIEDDLRSTDMIFEKGMTNGG